MYLAEGAGLSAIQVGVPLRIFLGRPRGGQPSAHRPTPGFHQSEIVRLSDEAQTGTRGVFRFPGYSCP